MDNLGPDIFGRKEAEPQTNYGYSVQSSDEIARPAPGINPAKIKVIGVGGGGGNAVPVRPGAPCHLRRYAADGAFYIQRGKR